MDLEELAVTLTMLGLDKYEIKYDIKNNVKNDYIKVFIFKLVENPNLCVFLQELLTQYGYQWEYLHYTTQMKIFKK